MNDVQNLSSREAVEQLRKLVEASPTGMVATRLAEIPFHVCPLQIQQVDDHGDLWIFSGADSAHNAHILSDPRVQLTFSNNSHYEFLVVFGTAEITTDRSKIDELWDPSVKAWFPDGKEDPNLTLIRIRPQLAHYWATKGGKVVTLAKMLASAVTGKIPDVGVHGDLKV